jgi:hypothetical protein
VGKSTDWVEHMRSWMEKTLGEIGHLAESAFLKFSGGMVNPKLAEYALSHFYIFRPAFSILCEESNHQERSVFTGPSHR